MLTKQFTYAISVLCIEHEALVLHNCSIENIYHFENIYTVNLAIQ